MRYYSVKISFVGLGRIAGIAERISLEVTANHDVVGEARQRVRQSLVVDVSVVDSSGGAPSYIELAGSIFQVHGRRQRGVVTNVRCLSYTPASSGLVLQSDSNRVHGRRIKCKGRRDAVAVSTRAGGHNLAVYRQFISQRAGGCGIVIQHRGAFETDIPLQLAAGEM